MGSNLACRIGLHRFRTTADLPAPSPAHLAHRDECTRPGCLASRVVVSIRPGWVNDRICDDPACHTDREHPPHTAWQRAAIARQRRPGKPA